MKPTALLLLAPLLLLPEIARADPKAMCLDGAAKGQTARDAHKLVEAREQFRICAAAACPEVVRNDCTTWLAEIERALPTIVLSAKSGAGASLGDVKVTMDGKPFVTILDGNAMPLDPGAHAFHFELADGTHADRKAVVNEGERSQKISVVLGVAPAAAPVSVAPPPNDDAASSSSRPWRTTGLVIGGVGIAGLAVGAVFGVVTLSKKSSAHCNDGVCDPDSVDSIKTTSHLSTIGLAAGGVLLAGGAALVLFGPKGRETAVAPAVSPGTAGLVAAGRF